MTDKLAAIILGAGLGTRMKSSQPKVLHEIAGQSMLAWVQTAAAKLRPMRCVTVLGPEAADLDLPGEVIIQNSRRGTGHATQIAAATLNDFSGWVLVLYGDSPLIRAETLIKIIETGKSAGADLVVAGFTPADPQTYGRLVMKGNKLSRIVEYKDANESERLLNFCNGGLMAFRAPMCLNLLQNLSDQNAAGEIYLTELVRLVTEAGGHCMAFECDEVELLGANTRAELAILESHMQDRLRSIHLAAGVSMQDPNSVHLSFDTKIDVDTVLEPYQIIGPGVTLGRNVRVRGFCHLEGVRIDDNAQIGPYARLRPGTSIGEGARVGNFVEVKNAGLGARAKANHLAYIGDAEVGDDANIGAGTITCNYDGVSKHKTQVGSGCFIGSNSALVAPIQIGDGAIVGAGSTLTMDVPDQSLVVARGTARSISGGATALRKKLLQQKATGE